MLILKINFTSETNLDAKNFRLMETSEKATSKENWKEVVAHREDVLLEGMDIFKDYMVLSERKAGITQIRVHPWKGEEHYIDFKEDAYMAYTSTNPEFDTEILRLGYTSLATPNSTFDYNMKIQRDGPCSSSKKLWEILIKMTTNRKGFLPQQRMVQKYRFL